MIGTQHENSDFLFYLDPPEIPLLLNQREIAGHFLAHQRSLIQMTLRADDAFCRQVKTPVYFSLNAGGPFDFVVSGSVLDRLVHQGVAEPHLGWCHVKIHDSSKLDLLGQEAYGNLKDKIALVLSNKNH
jgi:hypothetical protein